MPAYPNPLNDQDCAELTAIGQSCHGTSELIKDCIDCGLPFDDQKNANEMQAEFARKLKAKFFPYKP